MEQSSGKKFPLSANDYKLYEEIGDGVSATVYQALCVPLNDIVAIKVLDLEKCNNDLDGIRREVQTMTLTNHSNLLRAHCSFTAGHNLWVVMPYMAAGSCLHIMKSAYPEGFEEPVIATLLCEVLKALVYLHAHGHIHRDVKAGNILLDKNGAVKLADFGVSACMFDTGDRQRSRNTFVGTPCWMAPEVMQQLHGYDFKADIWSLGITALELAHGHAPFYKYPPMKVLLMTLQNAPPGLDYERDKRFSKRVDSCLLGERSQKRPSSEKLLKHHFFKQARSNVHLFRTILDGLSPLGERYRNLKAKEADLLVQNKDLYGDKDQLSQQEYIRGISAWNFNLEDLKNQAALIPDSDGASTSQEPSVRSKNSEGCIDTHAEMLFPEKTDQLDVPTQSDDELSDIPDLESSLAGFPLQPLQGLKGCFDVYVDDAVRLDSEQLDQINPSTTDEDQEDGRNRENTRAGLSLTRAASAGPLKLTNGFVFRDSTFSPKKLGVDGDRELVQQKSLSERNYCGPLIRQRKDTNGIGPEDTTEGAVVQRKGRFKVTSAELSPKGSTNTIFNSVGGASSTSSLSAGSVLPSLQGILQQNALQKEEILRLVKFVEQTSGSSTASFEIPVASGRERELQTQVIQLQQSIGSLIEEVQRQKSKNVQLGKKLSSLVKKV